MYPTGTCEIGKHEGCKIVFTAAGEHADQAQNTLLRVIKKQAAKAQARAAGIKLVEPTEPIRLDEKIAELLKDARRRGASEAAEINQRIMGELARVTGCEWVDQTTRDTIYLWHEALQAQREW